jgi:hypothetical protein
LLFFLLFFCCFFGVEYKNLKDLVLIAPPARTRGGVARQSSRGFSARSGMAAAGGRV